MSIDFLNGTFELKRVDLDQRIIEAHVSIFGNVDRVNDIVDRKAFDRFLASNDIKNVAVSIGHNLGGIPFGIPLEIRPDDTGLFTRTKIFETTTGNDLLIACKALNDNGQSMGASFTYATNDAKFEKVGGKTVRRLLDLDLKEYCFASPQITANDQALVTAVKAVLDSAARDNLDASDFAYIDSEGGKHLPVQDAAHVRAALARFNQVSFESDSAKSKAWRKVLAAAKREGVDVEDESMPKAQTPDLEQKADAPDPELKKVVKAHQDALEAHAHAVSELHKYHGNRMASMAEGSPAEEAGESPSQEAAEGGKTLAALLAAFETKAGAMMNKEHLGQLHGAMAALGNLHDANCKDPDCPQRMGGAGTDEGVGSSKTVPVDQSLASYRERFAALSA